MENYAQLVSPPPPASRPRPIGQLAAIGAGYFTEIVDIIAPASAAYGDLVTVEVRVKNIWTGPFYIAVSGHHDGVDAYFSPDYAVVNAGQTYSFTYSFTMPNSDIRFHIWSHYWVEPEWHDDDYGYVDIALAAVPEPEFRGFGVSEYQPV